MEFRIIFCKLPYRFRNSGKYGYSYINAACYCHNCFFHEADYRNNNIRYLHAFNHYFNFQSINRDFVFCCVCRHSSIRFKIRFFFQKLFLVATRAAQVNGKMIILWKDDKRFSKVDFTLSRGLWHATVGNAIYYGIQAHNIQY